MLVMGSARLVDGTSKLLVYHLEELLAEVDTKGCQVLIDPLPLVIVNILTGFFLYFPAKQWLERLLYDLSRWIDRDKVPERVGDRSDALP